MGTVQRCLAAAVFLACAEVAVVKAMNDDILTVHRVVQYQLLSERSGRFVGATPEGCIHAMGDIRGAYSYVILER